jgi:hypothetical protein
MRVDPQLDRCTPANRETVNRPFLVRGVAASSTTALSGAPGSNGAFSSVSWAGKSLAQTLEFASYFVVDS